MNFEDIKDRIKSESQNLWAKFQESSLYLKLQDRFENLSPSGQKFALIGAAILIALILFSIPFGSFTASQEKISDFETKRSLIRELFKVNQESSGTAQIPSPLNEGSIRSRVQSELANARLLPEQVAGIDAVNESSNLIPAQWLETILKVRLVKLNLRQIVDIGYQFSNLAANVKMKDFAMQANATDQRYFDVIYKLAVLKVPQVEAEEPAEPVKPAAKKKVK
jgi:hypothetical protein